MPFMEREQSISLLPSSDISQGSGPKLLCSLPGEEWFTLWPWGCKGLRPEPLGTPWFSAHGGRGTLCPDISGALPAGDSGCCVRPCSCAFPVSNGGGLKFV